MKDAPINLPPLPGWLLSCDQSDPDVIKVVADMHDYASAAVLADRAGREEKRPWTAPGWKTVPIEPTRLMNEAAEKEYLAGNSTTKSIYRAMMNEAPNPPLPSDVTSMKRPSDVGTNAAPSPAEPPLRVGETRTGTTVAMQSPETCAAGWVRPAEPPAAPVQQEKE